MIFIALYRIPNIDCYRRGAVPNIKLYTSELGSPGFLGLIAVEWFSKVLQG